MILDALSPKIAITLISLVISIVSTLIYKWTTDQDLMKRLKDEIKELQKQMKTLTEHPEELSAVQKKSMEANMKYMSASMKPTLYTIIPIILIFGWLQGQYSFEPIMPGQDFTIQIDFEKGTQGTLKATAENMIVNEPEKQIQDNKAIIGLTANETGTQTLKLEFNDKKHEVPIQIGEKTKKNTISIKKDGIKQAVINYKKLIVLNLFGWQIGWIGTYIISSIIFSMILRKAMKIY